MAFPVTDISAPDSSAIRRALGLVVTLAVGALVALVLVSQHSSAQASPYPPYPPSTGCTVSTTTVDAGPGDAVTFVGSGFGANQSVALSIPSASAALGSVQTDGTGSFKGTFTWPASVSGAKASVQASAPSVTCSFILTNSHFGTGGKTGHRSSHSGGTNSSSGLSSTGFAALTATTIALVLVGGGALFLGLARRRRRA